MLPSPKYRTTNSMRGEPLPQKINSLAVKAKFPATAHHGGLEYCYPSLDQGTRHETPVQTHPRPPDHRCPCWLRQRRIRSQTRCPQLPSTRSARTAKSPNSGHCLPAQRQRTAHPAGWRSRNPSRTRPARLRNHRHPHHPSRFRRQQTTCLRSHPALCPQTGSPSPPETKHFRLHGNQ